MCKMAQESLKPIEETGCPPPEGPIPCAQDCGFYGTPETMNLCSKCYKIQAAATTSSSATLPPDNDVLTKTEMEARHRCLWPNPEASGCNRSAIAIVTPPAGESSTATTSEGASLGGGSSSTTLTTEVVADDSAKRSSQGPNRCFSCRKRVGLTGFACKCGNLYCSVHRYSDKHECSFDYKTVGRDAIAQANPVIKAEKIEKV